jgi:hypothetical protein
LGAQKLFCVEKRSILLWICGSIGKISVAWRIAGGRKLEGGKPATACCLSSLRRFGGHASNFACP